MHISVHEYNSTETRTDSYSNVIIIPTPLCGVLCHIYVEHKY